MAYDLFLFDFDGVLFNTNRIKTEAFRQTLSEYPSDAVEEFVAYHEATGGVSRYVKIAHFFNVILRRSDDTEAEQARALDRFAQVGPALMATSSPLPGVPEFLAAIARTRAPAAICSGGNSNEIKTLLRANHLDHFIAEIWGNERSKSEHAHDSIAPRFDRVLFFGDARYDMEVAERFDFDFIFVASLSDWPEGKANAAARGHTVIDDFKDPLLSGVVGG